MVLMSPHLAMRARRFQDLVTQITLQKLERSTWLLLDKISRIHNDDRVRHFFDREDWATVLLLDRCSSLVVAEL